MFDVSCCASFRPAETPVVNSTALEGLNTLRQDGVLEDRHSSLGGADADPQDSAPTAPTPAVGVVSSPARGDRLAQVATRDSAKGEDIVSQAASRIRANSAAARGEGR